MWFPAVEFENAPYEKQHYIETSTGNIISRHSQLCGSQNLRLAGKCVIRAGAILRGDLATIAAGKFVYVGDQTILRPCSKKIKGVLSYFPLQIGDHVTIEDGCIIEAASIGNNVYIGKNCIIGARCIVKDNSYIAEGSLLAADTVVAPLSMYQGKPAVLDQELFPSFVDAQQHRSVALYNSIRHK